ncbi:TRAP transporter small permease [Oceaniglobus indicus]|uniref:TRAP transporter small permease n=1 Tax=Oceaniglobus indicus TaxID=2047749 RepID=UPI00130415C8|nr:TRAP transporter small permease [Oceaniglobus indicus]
MHRLFREIDRLVETLIFVIFLAIVIVGTAQVLNRYALNSSLSWSEEFQKYGQIWLVFLSIPVAYRRGMHIGMDLLDDWFSPRGRRLFSLGIDFLWLLLAGSVLYGLNTLMPLLARQKSPGLGMPMDWAYGGLVVGMVYLIFVSLRRIVVTVQGRDIPKEHIGS